MKKAKLKKKIKIKLNKFQTIIITLLIVALSVVLMIKHLSNQIGPIVFSYSKSEAKKISNIIINEAVKENISNKITEKELFKVTNDSNGEIKSIDYNSNIINKLLTQTTTDIQQEIKNIQSGNIDNLKYKKYIFNDYNKNDLEKGIIYRFSMGAAFNNNVLSSVGPKIPIKIILIGNVSSNIKTNIKNYGINNAVIQVYVEIKVNEKMILPFLSEDIKISTEIPVGIKIVTGTVPNYYVNGKSEVTPNIAVPSE